jgi:hypothetical protein
VALWNVGSYCRMWCFDCSVLVGMVSKPPQEATPEFQIQQEDFPALPGVQS